jgi:hypothetical protein
MKIEYTLKIPGGTPRHLATGWLILGIVSLVFAGMLSILLVLSRTPFIQDFFPWINFFHKALVVHVDLSVLIWFLAFAGVFWSINSTSKLSVSGWIALILSAAGTVIISLSPFMDTGNPLMNNYIPVIDNTIFFTGLITFGAGFTLLLLRSLFSFPSPGRPVDAEGSLRLGIYSSTIIAAIAVASFFWSYILIPPDISGIGYYEILFWGGGHLLQFVHTILMIVSWLFLSSISGLSVNIRPKSVIILFGIGLIATLTTPLIYLSYGVASVSFRNAFTTLMKYGMGLPVLIIAFTLLRVILRGDRKTGTEHLKAALITSILLFGAGGIIGFLIQGINVTIPAHYHGAIVGVTLAYMGITYHLLPGMGFRKPLPALSHLQPYLYGFGQLINIIGLALAGGYGVMRKTPGSAQMLDSMKKIASMGLMGLGGLIAVIGGVLFLVITIHAMWPGRAKKL